MVGKIARQGLLMNFYFLAFKSSYSSCFFCPVALFQRRVDG